LAIRVPSQIKNPIQTSENSARYSLKAAFVIALVGHLSALVLNVKQNRSGSEKNCEPFEKQAILDTSITGLESFLNFSLHSQRGCEAPVLTFLSLTLRLAPPCAGTLCPSNQDMG